MRRFRPGRPPRPRRAFRRLAAGLFGPPPRPGMGFGPGPMQELERANRLMAAGDYDEAADLFGQLADGAEAHGMPVRAAHLHLQTARALLELGRPDDAFARAKRGLEILSNTKPGQAAQIAPKVVEGFRAKGYEKQADELVAGLPHNSGWEKSTDYAARRGSLPEKCPHCGGAMRADEVEWIDAASAECGYCGGVVKAE